MRIQVIASEIATLDNLSVDELVTRLAKIEEMGKSNAASIARGNVGEVVGSHIVRGRWVETNRNVAALNGQRLAWAITNAALKARRSA